MSAPESEMPLSVDEEDQLGAVGSPSDTFESTVDILEVSEKSKLLGELVRFEVEEGDGKILVLGQITEVKTENRWHQEPSFKGIIKRHGNLPHLSGSADSRIAKINVQSSFRIPNNDSQNYEAHKLANSPSTGVPVDRINNTVMTKIMEQYKNKVQLVCLGNAYDTDVKIPFWFKHFGKPNKGGAGDSYHIGVFGRTGSGKTTAAANMILGYARHYEHMSILILDPQEQFYEDNEVLPGSLKFEQEIKKSGMKYAKYRVPDGISLPDDADLFSDLLSKYNFIRKAFNLHTEEKRNLMAESIREYVAGRKRKPTFRIGDNSEDLLKSMLRRFIDEEKYINNVYASGQWNNRLRSKIEDMVASGVDSESIGIWKMVCELFAETGGKERLENIVKKVVSNPGNTIILNISGRGAVDMDSIQTVFVKIIEDAIKDAGAKMYAEGETSNCLVVLDEAHRYINTYSHDDEIKRLTGSIIDAVRTTRKYGIGYMFITQTIDSLHEEIRRQIRLFAFGYGLTSGSEFNKIKDIINDDSAGKFYRSFIDPASNSKFPFMFYGPISPLSFTGAPLFLEMNGAISDFSTE